MSDDHGPRPIAELLPPNVIARLGALGVDFDDLDRQHPPEPNRETPEDRAERLANRRAVFRRRWEAQVPPMYAQATFADLDQDQRFRWPDDSLNLVLAGAVGTGKTHAAYAVGNHLAALGQWVQAVTLHDLLAAMRPDGDQQLARAARECWVLILDDLGATKATDFAVEQMVALLDVRIREGRRTIVTTNSTEPELEAAWGGRFMDRLGYRRTVHVFRGESRRAGAW